MFQPWCDHCVAGKGKDASHFRVEPQGDPVVYADYNFLSEDGRLTRESSDIKGSQPMLTVLVAVDRDTQACLVHVCDSKGSKDTATVKLFARWLEVLGYKRLRLHMDSEPATLDLVRAVKKAAALDVVPRHSPPHSSQSLGPGEQIHFEISGTFRAAKQQLEQRLGVKIELKAEIVRWMLRHAGWCRTRFAAKAGDGSTPFYRLYGVAYHGMVADLGEKVMARVTTSKSAHKFQSRWTKGCWLGKSEIDDTHIIGTDQGSVFMTRTIRRLPAADAWDAELVLAVRATPTKFKVAPPPPRPADPSVAFPPDKKDDSGSSSSSSDDDSDKKEPVDKILNQGGIPSPPEVLPMGFRFYRTLQGATRRRPASILGLCVRFRTLRHHMWQRHRPQIQYQQHNLLPRHRLQGLRRQSPLQRRLPRW